MSTLRIQRLPKPHGVHTQRPNGTVGQAQTPRSYAAIRQRIDIQYVVGRLDRVRTTDYISAQLAYAYADREIFTEAAIDEAVVFTFVCACEAFNIVGANPK